MNFNHDIGLIDTVQTIDVTALPPLGGVAGVLTIVGDGAISLPHGLTAARPASPSASMIRFSDTFNLLEFYDGTQWSQLSTSTGTVSSVTLTTTAGMTVSGGTTQTIGSTGSFDLVLSTDLQALSALAGTGIVVRTGAATYAERTLTSTAATIAITNGDGVAAAPNLDLATVGTPVTANFVKVTTDAFGRITDTTPVVTADITGLVDGTYVNTTGDTMSGALDMGGNAITNLADPSQASDAATKSYVDASAAGLSWKTSVKAATTANIDLATTGLAAIDGITPVDGDRILVKNQTADAENGIYLAHAGAWVRSTDMDSTTPVNEVNGAAVFVEEGSTQASTAYTQVDQVATIGTDPIQWVQFSGVGTYTAGNGLALTGNVFSLTSPVTIANGGTGLSAGGAADQLLSMNAAGTGLEYKTVSGSTGLTVVPGVGTLTLTNTGVTSVAGTANQITASAATGTVTLSIPTDFQVPGTESVVGSLTLNPARATGNIGVNLVIYGNTANDLQDWVLNDGATVAAKVDPTGALYLYKGLGDTNNSLGTSGQVLSSNGSGIVWIDSAATPVTSLSFGTTGLTPATATTGDIVVAGILNVANGGTGLTALGTANQVLGVNAAGTTAEYKTIAAGTGVSVVHTANTVTINNTGVTSVGLTAPVSLFTVTGSPVTTTGTLDIALATQVANTVFAGPASGADAVPAFRALAYADLPLKLYVENPATVIAPTAVGANSVAVGSGSSAAADASFAVGAGAITRVAGQKAFANGSFATAGDAQHGVYVLRGVTVDATAVPLFMDGTTTQLIVPDNSVVTFSIMIAARRTDAVGGGASYKFEGGVRKDATAASVTFIGAASKTVLGETNTPWDVSIAVDTTTGALVVSGKGEAAKTVSWVATVLTTEVTN